ncbi:hypothetical protein [Pseudonocardia acidicola]|uniref:Secreted protein n=1 Tax=Pseudonocardia acidicola TaxID=2724939 RepID=A0ABX1SHE6_9PSEU|nr:hypothetical protein [Pseudonocardia acidicola]NMH99583.1 hypothetical protein [Pseudonocardia acidicola]
MASFFRLLSCAVLAGIILLAGAAPAFAAPATPTPMANTASADGPSGCDSICAQPPAHPLQKSDVQRELQRMIDRINQKRGEYGRTFYTGCSPFC